MPNHDDYFIGDPINDDESDFDSDDLYEGDRHGFEDWDYDYRHDDDDDNG